MSARLDNFLFDTPIGGQLQPEILPRLGSNPALRVPDAVPAIARGLQKTIEI